MPRSSKCFLAFRFCHQNPVCTPLLPLLISYSLIGLTKQHLVKNTKHEAHSYAILSNLNYILPLRLKYLQGNINELCVCEHELLKRSAPAEHTKFVGFWCMPNDCNWTTLTWLVVTCLTETDWATQSENSVPEENLQPEINWNTL